MSDVITMKEAIVAVVVAAVASSGFWEFMKWMISSIKKKKYGNSPQEDALLAILHDRLYYLLTMYSTADHIDPNDYDNLLSLYNAYKSLNGNGLIKKLFEQVEKLKIKQS